MRKFVYASCHLKGEVITGFDKDTGLLVYFDITQAEITEEQHTAFLMRFPRNLFELQELVKEKPTERTITEIQDTVSFEMFWDKYNHKQLSHKKKSLKIWERMTEATRLKAYLFITKYENLILKQGIQKKHAETYLTAELWDN